MPFCARKCDYCHFYVIPDKPSFHEPFLRALKSEWQLRKHLLPDQGLVSIYFGGGTPSRLNVLALEEILTWIQPDSSVEITLEANPDHVTLEDLYNYRRIGINRLSLGVQSLHDGMLQKLSRTHRSSHACSVIDQAYQCGLTNLSIDLMYDLPDQTLEIWQQTLDRVCQLPITHLSLYNLTIEPHTVFYKKRHALKVPDAETSLLMLRQAEETLASSGFERYEISAFAKESKLSRHNMGYWTDRPFLGFGPSAFSDWNKKRFQNVPHFWRYVKACQEGRDPTGYEEQLDSTERERERLTVGLRVLKGVQTHKPNLGLDSLIEEGWLEQDGSWIRLTSQGRLFYDTVCEKIYGLDLSHFTHC